MKNLLKFCAAIGLLAMPTLASAQQAGQFSAIGSAAPPFHGFSGPTFGFNPDRFYRLASGPGGFQRWHQAPRRGFTGNYYRVLEIDRIGTYVVVLDLLDNRRVPFVSVGR